jgi:opacity protein-like surface antigen
MSSKLGVLVQNLSDLALESIMKKIFPIILFAYLGFISHSVSAQSRFNGLYTGIDLGYFSGKDEGTEYVNGVPNGYTNLTKPKGATYGLEVGFNHVLPEKILLGIDLSIHYINKSNSSVQDYEGVPSPSFPIQTTIQNRADLKAKVGYVFNEDNSSVFLTGGLSMAKIKRMYASGDLSTTSTNNTLGYILGAGAEHFFFKNISLKAEYLYTKYKQNNIDTSAVWGSGFTESQNYKDNTIRLGLNYYFN